MLCVCVGEYKMETKIKVMGRPSSPREFFQRIYGNSDDDEEKQKTVDGSGRVVENNSRVTAPAEILTPVPILANPFFLPQGIANDVQLTAAAAGLSAFCKNNYTSFISYY